MTNKEALDLNNKKIEEMRLKEFDKYFKPYKEDINNSILHLAKVIENTQKLTLKEIEEIKKEVSEWLKNPQSQQSHPQKSVPTPQKQSKPKQK